ncbi:hypothetical protein EON67_04215, partial [archaeon]
MRRLHGAENARLKNQFKTQEDDREYLIKQLVAAKKDNARLREDLNVSREDVAALQAEAEQLRIQNAFYEQDAAAAAEGRAAAVQSVQPLAVSLSSEKLGVSVALIGGHESMAARTGAASPRASEGIDFGGGDVDAMVASAMGGGGSLAATGGTASLEAENRYRDLILRLKKLLDAERKAVRTLRAQLNTELSARSEAEMFLRRAIEDAKIDL